MGAFHAYDIRGVYNKDFDKDTAYKVGYFIPRLLNTDKVLVGRDVRVSSPEIWEYLVKGITDAGANVADLGLATTPMVYWTTAKYGFKASVQITASHNPREYNGMKVSTTNALPIGLDNGLGKIQSWIENNEPVVLSAKKGTVEKLNITDEYIKFQLQYKEDYSNLSIGVDISNGMAGLIIKDILGTDSNLHYLFSDLDGTFPNHEANPLIPENVEALKKLVQQERCDIGVIYDGDADRVMFVDENSRFISPDLIIALLGNYWFGKRKMNGTVLQDIRSSKAVGEYLNERYGADMYTWKVGRAFAARKLREIDGLYGGELAGHYYFREFFYSDSGIMASLLVINIVSELKAKGIKLSQAIAEIERYKNSGEINFKLDRKQEAMDAVKDYFIGLEKPTAFMDFDGYRVEFPCWWFNIRPSNTEPYLRFIVEANTEELLKEKISKATEIINTFSASQKSKA